MAKQGSKMEPKGLFENSKLWENFAGISFHKWPKNARKITSLLRLSIYASDNKSLYTQLKCFELNKMQSFLDAELTFLET